VQPGGRLSVRLAAGKLATPQNGPERATIAGLSTHCLSMSGAADHSHFQIQGDARENVSSFKLQGRAL